MALAALALIAGSAAALAPAADAAGPLPSSTAVAASPASSTVGTPVTLTADVSVLGLGGLLVTPTGSVTFTAVNAGSSQTLGTAAISSPCLLTTCFATLTTSALPVGESTVTAAYGGDSLAAASTAQTTVTVTGPPAAPVLAAPVAAVDKLSLSWSAPSAAPAISGYRVYRATTAGASPASPLATLPASATTYDDATVTAPTRYYYTVSAVNSVGEGARSNEVSGVPLAPAPPAAPTLTATDQVGSVLLTWTATSTGGRPVTGYNLYRSDSAAGTYVQIASGLPTGSYQDTTIPVGTTFYYQATTTNSVGESPRSNTASGRANPSAFGAEGAETHDEVTCPPGQPCASDQVEGEFAGSSTTSWIGVDRSSSAHTATIALSDTTLTGCGPLPPAGISVTFNDTSTDARKIVTWTIRGAAADTWYAAYGSGSNRDGCLGLGTPWFSGDSSHPAIWNPADGLYEAAPARCAISEEFHTPNTLKWSQPCYERWVHLGDADTSKHWIVYAFSFPPGDGKISGGAP